MPAPIYRLDWDARMALMRVYLGRLVEVELGRIAAGQTVRGVLVSCAFNTGGGASDAYVIRTSTRPTIDHVYSGALIANVRELPNA